MAQPVYLAELTAKVWPKFLRSGTPNAYGTQYSSQRRVPVSSLSTYTMRAVIRSGDSADGFAQAGIQLWDAAGNVIGDPWAWSWIAPARVLPGTGWTTYTADFGAGTGKPLPAGAAYMAPAVLLNYAGTTGYMDCMDCMVSLAATPSAALTADRYMRDPAMWTLWSGGTAGSFRTLTTGGDSVAQSLTLRYATQGYMTHPTDTPAKTYYDGRLLQPGLLRQELPPDFSGAAAVSYGELVLLNADGALGELAYYGLDGQQVVIKRGEAGAAYSTFATVMTATMEQPLVDRQRCRIRLRGPDARLERPLLTGRYAGNNALPNGLEGGAELAGQPKPRVYGVVENISPPCINTSRLIYQVSDSALGCSTNNVYVAGVALTAGALYTSQSDMETNAPAAGTYRAWPAGGMFRLGTTPTGRVTCNAAADPSGHGNPWELWNVLYQVAYDAGVQASEFYKTQSTTWPQPDNWQGTWATDQPHVGLWVTDLRTAADAMAELARSLGVWFGFTRDSVTSLGAVPKLKAEPFPPPFVSYSSGYAAYLQRMRFDRSHILAVSAVAAPGAGRGLPTWKVDLSFRKNYSVLQPAEMPSLTPATYGFFEMENRRTQAADVNVLNKHATAQAIEIDTCIANDATGAGYEANRQLLLRRQPRPWYEVRLSLDALASTLRYPLPVLGSYVYLEWPELRLVREDGSTQAEGWFTLHALELDWSRNEARMTVRQAPQVLY